jgi:hypothetical protein
MRLVVCGKTGDRVVDAALVDIGSDSEQFAAHRSIDPGMNGAGAWSVSHVASGFRIATGGSAAEALEAACAKWKSTTSEEHARAFAHALDIRVARQNKALDEVLS